MQADMTQLSTLPVVAAVSSINFRVLFRYCRMHYDVFNEYLFIFTSLMSTVGQRCQLMCCCFSWASDVLFNNAIAN